MAVVHDAVDEGVEEGRGRVMAVDDMVEVNWEGMKVGDSRRNLALEVVIV
jgi:hypothetical protein